MASAQWFDSSPPDVVSRCGDIRSWIIDPPGMLNIAREGAFVTAEMARFISGEVEAAMKCRHTQATKFTYVHDFSGIVGYVSEARRILTEWGLSRIGEVERVIMVTSPSRPLIRMAISTVEAVLRVAGMNIEVAQDLGSVIERYRIRSPRA